MIKLVVLGLAILSQACLLPTGGQQSDSQSGPEIPKCVEIKNQNDCKANPNCKINIWTNKCVDAQWENAVKAEECKEIKGVNCGVGSAIPISKAGDNDPSKLEVFGLCGKDDSGYWCQEAPLADPSYTGAKQCVLTEDKTTWQKAAAEICNKFQQGKGTDRSRRTITGFCSGIALDAGQTGASLVDFCQKEEGTKSCQLAKQPDMNRLQRFCQVLSKKRFVTDPQFTGIKLEEFVDESACTNRVFITAPKPINNFDQVVGTVQNVCVVKTK